MKVVVCIKEVPDTEAYIKIGSDQKSMDENNVTFVMNPYDEYAIEEAIKIQEEKGGETTAVCIGTDRAAEVLRSAIAMGIQKAVLIKSDVKHMDSFSASSILAQTLKEMEFDLLMVGKETIDDGSLQVGPMLGELLDLPCVTLINKLELGDGKVTVERETDGGTEVIEVSLPCVLTTQKGLNEPRYPSLRGKMMAKKAVIEEKEAPAVEAKVEMVSMQHPPARGEGKIVGEGPEAAGELVRLLREEAKVI